MEVRICDCKNAPPPETPPLLGEFTLMIASLGGYLNRKCDGPPGPKTMWVGLQRMVDFALAWKAFGQMQSETQKGKKEMEKDVYKHKVLRLGLSDGQVAVSSGLKPLVWRVPINPSLKATSLYTSPKTLVKSTGR